MYVSICICVCVCAYACYIYFECANFTTNLTFVSVVLHRFVLRKQEFLLPFVLVCKCLLPLTDEELYARIIQNNTNNTFLTTRVELLIRDFRSYNLYTTSQCRAYVGALFRNSIPNISSTYTDGEVGLHMLNRYVCVHAEGYGDKVEVLIYMLRKLYAFAEGRCMSDNTDSFSHHELLLPGHLIGKCYDLCLCVICMSNCVPTCTQRHIHVFHLCSRL